ncbi:ABC transporter ATP-binding protein [Streptomyces aurantiacus]|uniref:ABC transporter ATP-binding protein n=1 Tax=Streptomyces aurantiacus TaxID=47760 RepID=UPI00099633A7|nr:ABC transporter ATP-binding protein [Streptomyces aurantiacus]
MIKSSVPSLRIDQLRNVTSERLGLLRLSVQDSRAGSFLVLVHCGRAVVPAATALAIGWLGTELTDSVSGRQSAAATVWPLVLMCVLLVADEVLTALAGAMEQYIAGRVDARARRFVRHLALAPQEMAHLEDSQFADDAARVSEDSGGVPRSPGMAAVGQLRLVFRMAAAFGAAAVVAWMFSWALALVLLTTSLTMRALLRRWWIYLAAVRDEREGLRRRAEYWTEVASAGSAGKEVRLFGLHEWVVRRRTREFLSWVEVIWSARRGVLRRQWWIAALAGIGACSALLLPALAAVHGTLPAVDVMPVLVAAWGVFAIGPMGQEAFDIEYGLGAVRALDRLTAAHGHSAAATAVEGNGKAEANDAVPAEIRAEGLVFRYPRAKEAVVSGLDLIVSPGEVLALVGENGVGKTTLIKVIAGLHLPTGGRLLVDGSPVEGSDLAVWRRRVATVFQDFNQYPLSAADNIALAAPEYRDDLEGVRAAARRAGAASFVEQLPHGYETVLTSGRTGGTDLSGGQWQRIAIARAIFAVEHGRDVLILDEPTAHLDVEAEARFYGQIIAEVSGATVLLISHRLSTVRNADRIVLLEDGRIVEQGSHDELMVSDRGYARLFRLQAARFTGKDGQTDVTAQSVEAGR